MVHVISGELWPGFKSKALRSSTLCNATALYTPLYELELLLVCNHFMLHAAFSYISFYLKHNLCCFTEWGVYIYVYFTNIILTFKFDKKNNWPKFQLCFNDYYISFTYSIVTIYLLKNNVLFWHIDNFL